MFKYSKTSRGGEGFRISAQRVPQFRTSEMKQIYIFACKGSNRLFEQNFTISRRCYKAKHRNGMRMTESGCGTGLNYCCSKNSFSNSVRASIPTSCSSAARFSRNSSSNLALLSIAER